MNVEKIYTELVEIKISQVRMESDIKEHMRRTEILEEAVIPLNNVYNIGKWVVAVVVGLIGLAASLVKIIELFNH